MAAVAERCTRKTGSQTGDKRNSKDIDPCSDHRRKKATFFSISRWRPERISNSLDHRRERKKGNKICRLKLGLSQDINRPPRRDVGWRQRLKAQRKEEQTQSQVAKQGSQTLSMKSLRQKLQKGEKWRQRVPCDNKAQQWPELGKSTWFAKLWQYQQQIKKGSDTLRDAGWSKK